MKTLLFRELRRQLPPLLASLALGVILVVAGALLQNPGPGAIAAFATVALATPLLLGVATVAPDVENGGEAFLAMLPLSRARALGVRWSVALAYTLLATGLASLPALLSDEPGRLLHSALDPELAVAPLLLLAGGFLASVAARSTLVGFVVAPICVVLPALAFYRFAHDLLAAPREILEAGAWLLGPGLAVAAAIAYAKGDVSRGSWRAAKLGALVLGLEVALMATVTTGAFAYDLTRRGRSVSSMPSIDGRRVCYGETIHGCWSVYARTHWQILDERGAGAWHDLGDTFPVGFSPDATKLVCLKSSPTILGLALMDVASGAIEPIALPPGAVDAAVRSTGDDMRHFWSVAGMGEAPRLELSGWALLWRNGHEPRFFATRTVGDAVTTIVAEATGTTEIAGEPECWASTTLVVRGTSGERTVVSLSSAPARTAPLELPAGLKLEAVELSPRGRHLLALGARDTSRGETLVHLAIGDDGKPRLVSVVAIPGDLDCLHARWNPAEDAFALSWTRPGERATTLFDASTDASRGKIAPLAWDQPWVWSPGGTRALAGATGIVDVTSGRTLGAGSPAKPLFFADEGHLVVSTGDRCVLLDVKTGETIPWPGQTAVHH